MNHKELIFENFEKFSKESQLSGNILDVGCGDNYFMPLMAKLGLNWIGMDLIRNENIFIKAYMEDIPIHDNIFNCVLCSHSFEHSTNPIQTLKEFRRILKIGGYIYLITPYPCDEQYFSMDKNHYFILNQNNLISLLRKVNFEVIKSYIMKCSENVKDWSIITIGVVS